MKLLLILLLFPIILHAQDIGPGLWMKATINYDDGSIEAAPATSSYQVVKYRFLPGGRVQIGTSILFYMTETDYSVKDSILYVGFIKYKIESLTEHVAVVHQAYNNTAATSISFLRPEDLLMDIKPEFNTAIQDSVYAANRYLFPDCDMTREDFAGKIGYFNDKGKFDISFIVSKTGKVVNFTIDGYADTEKEKKRAASVAKVFQSAKLKWLPARFAGKNVNSLVKLELVYDNTGKGDFGVINNMGFRMIF